MEGICSLNEKETLLVKEIIELCKAFSCQILPTGSGLKAGEGPSLEKSIHAPFCLHPSFFPKTLYEKSLVLQDYWNELVVLLARDSHFIDNIIEKLGNSDDFTLKLYEIAKETRDLNTPSLVIIRSDYMLSHTKNSQNQVVLTTCDQVPSKLQQVFSECELKQVEINTMVSSLFWLTHLYSNLRQTIVQEFPSEMGFLSNKPSDVIIESMIQAITYYNSLHSLSESIAIMVAQETECNAFEHFGIINELASRGIKMLRLTLAQVSKSAHHDSSFRFLKINDSVVSFVYFRAGYTPNDYPTQKHWEARLTLEKCNAIKCPSAAMQIIGTKKVQQVLFDKAILQKYLKDETACNALHESFVGLYPLENDADIKLATEKATADPHHYLLKPQREGGGNNKSAQEMTDCLLQMPHHQLSSYILMEKIIPPAFENILIRNGQSKKVFSVSELGIYGAVLWHDETVIYSNKTGYLLRTKTKDDVEGGFIAGYAYIDLISLV